MLVIGLLYGHGDEVGARARRAGPLGVRAGARVCGVGAVCAGVVR